MMTGPVGLADKYVGAALSDHLKFTKDVARQILSFFKQLYSLYNMLIYIKRVRKCVCLPDLHCFSTVSNPIT